MTRTLVSILASLAVLLFANVPPLVGVANTDSPKTESANAPYDLIHQATQVATSGGGCVVTSDGAVKCWGDNFFGQLGDGTTAPRSTPTDVSGLSGGIHSVVSGDVHSCALTSGGGVKCWGYGSNGQLGDGTQTHRHTPVDVVGLGSNISAISAGRDQTCALTSGGGVKCWGFNSHGQLGDGTRTYRFTPANVVGLGSGVIQIDAGTEYACALTTVGGVKCWGYNYWGQLGDGTTTDALTPVDVVGLGSGVRAISAGFSHTCAVMNSGGIKCWGANFYGGLGDGTGTNRSTPVDVIGLGGAMTTVNAGSFSSCAVTNGGAAKCWGANFGGILGDGTTVDRNSPVDVFGLGGGVVAISISHTACALTNGGAVKCWGRNELGQLGNGTLVDSFIPVGVVGFDTLCDQQNHADTDGDGLLDVWESCGYDADKDGSIDVNLPALGASPFRKDIFVEIDYMDSPAACIFGGCSIGHTHRPKQEAIDQVVQAFARAPVTNPYGSPGIALHVVVDQSMTERPVLTDSQHSWTAALDQIKYEQGYFDRKRQAIFHYVLFAHDISSGLVGTSGISRLGASDLIVSLGQYRQTVNEQAGTLMHELGHNLGLSHGGNEEVNYKPNYLSVMNYAFQMSGLRHNSTDGLLDYSRFAAIPDLNEESLDETVGLHGGAALSGYGTRVPCIQIPGAPPITFPVDNANGPINWDCDLLGRTDGIAIKANINADYDVNGVAKYTRLTTFDDWAFVKLGGGAIGKERSLSPMLRAPSAVDIPLDELTVQEDALIVRNYRVALQGGGAVVASLAVSSTSFITVSNLGALTTTIVLSDSSGPSWFNLGAMPVSVTLVPSSSLSFPMTLTVPPTRSLQITSSVSIWASPIESPQMGDVATLYTVIGPFARYEAMPMRGFGPFTVTFSDASIGQIASRLWSFGDGVTSTVVSPTHFYAMPGFYTATLTVTGPDGVDVTSGVSPIEMVILKVFMPMALR